MSTERTSVSAWSGKHDEAMDVDSAPTVPAEMRRPTGSYRLADFIIHRTLGTGSFGRVHLGEWLVPFQAPRLVYLVLARICTDRYRHFAL